MEFPIRADELIEQLEHGPAAFRGLFSGMGREERRWKPDPKSWSPLEVACHLLDEEREDFRARLRLLLSDPAAEWPPIEPERWALERRYLERDLTETLVDFATERARSVGWLQGLVSPDWSLAKRHPEFPPLSAGSLLGAWAAHDALHLRQLARLRYLWAQRLAQPHEVTYAGEWR